MRSVHRGADQRHQGEVPTDQGSRMRNDPYDRWGLSVGLRHLDADHAGRYQDGEPAEGERDYCQVVAG